MVVALDGRLGPEALVSAVLADADMVIAADGGAARLHRQGWVPDLVVGDLDSLEPAAIGRLEEAGAEFERHPREKDLTDGELALLAAIDRGAEQIVILGVLGGPRADMVLANYMLLFHPRLGRAGAVALAPGWTIWPLGRGWLDARSDTGATISLVPIDALIEGVDLEGVRWPLAGASLHRGEGRSISNAAAGTRVRARSRSGRALLFLERQDSDTRL